MKKKTATNSFEKGLIMDFNPLVMPDKTYCNALNATLITHNGNENVLQNDMGNGRVETAYLPEGYVPLGTAELGGIIYIVSYNPLINKCQIGSFPSPERNITSDESEGPEACTFDAATFYDIEEKDSCGNKIYHIKSTSIKSDINIILDGEELIFNPGDKYLLFFDKFDSENEEYNYLSAYNEISTLQYQYLPRYLSFQVLAVSENGLQFNMTEDNIWLPIKGLERDNKQSYYYINTSIEKKTGEDSYDLDEYRNLVSSNYNVFSSKQSGTLQVALNLECINSFDVSWDAYKLKSGEWTFYFYLNWTYNNDKSPDKINLHGIFCKYYLNNSISNQTPDYKKSELIEINGENAGYPIVINNEMTLGTTDIMLYQENISNDDYNVTFCTPYYIDALDDFVDQINNSDEGIINPYINGEIINNGISSFRKNDDSDFQYLLGKPFLVDENAKTDTGEDNIITMEVYPTMPYGVIDYLGTSFNINLAKLGTGQIILTTYKYYIQDSDIIFVYGFEAYPERNKKVKDVTFNFYEIDDPNTTSSVGEWIYNNSKYIDEYMLMYYNNNTGDNIYKWYDPTEWKETDYLTTNILSKYNENITPEDFSFIDDKESSYSGTFTHTFSKKESGLDNIGKTYIVEINVNYNNEKNICYYRIFYTQPIFNYYYYNDDYLDFKNIELDECLNISYNGNLISSKISNIDDTLNIITDLDEEKINNIPSYKLESTENIKYCINNTHQVNMAQLELNATDNYNLFNIEIELDEKSEIGIEINPENDAIVDNYGTDIINFDNITYDIIEEEGNFPIVYIDEDAKNTIILQYKIITHVPIFINYTNYKSANANYQLSHLSYDAYFMFGYGLRKWFHIYTSRYLYLDNDKESNCVKVSDDVGKEYILESATQIYDVLYDSLINNNNDVVLLACGTSCNVDKPFSAGISCGNSYIGNGYKNSNGDWKTYKSAKSLWDENVPLKFPNYYMLLNAFKSKNNEIIFITYHDSNNAYADTTLTITEPNDPPTSYIKKGYDGKHGGGTFIKTTNGNEIVDSNGYINGELLFKPFENLYKLVETEKTIEIYEYNELYFYDTFFNDINININCNYAIKLYINKNILIDNFNNIKNFNYNNNKKNTFNFIDSYKINSRQYIDDIMKRSDLIFVLDVDGNLVTNNIYVPWEENKLYTLKNNEYLKKSSLPYSSYNQQQLLEYNNQTLTIKIINTTYPTDLGIAFYAEELGIALRGVTII